MLFDFVSWLKARSHGEEGQALVEYALILTLVSVVSIGALAILGGKITDILNAVTTAL